MFQSTRPRGARPTRHACPTIERFNPRARAGRDLPNASGFAYEFQSTRPRGARPDARVCGSGCDSFNPRARAGRDGLSEDGSVPRSRFNPRARAGRDDGVDTPA